MTIGDMESFTEIGEGPYGKRMNVIFSEYYPSSYSMRRHPSMTFYIGCRKSQHLRFPTSGNRLTINRRRPI